MVFYNVYKFINNLVNYFTINVFGLTFVGRCKVTEYCGNHTYRKTEHYDNAYRSHKSKLHKHIVARKEECAETNCCGEVGEECSLAHVGNYAVEGKFAVLMVAVFHVVFVEQVNRVWNAYHYQQRRQHTRKHCEFVAYHSHCCQCPHYACANNQDGKQCGFYRAEKYHKDYCHNNERQNGKNYQLVAHHCHHSLAGVGKSRIAHLYIILGRICVNIFFDACDKFGALLGVNDFGVAGDGKHIARIAVVEHLFVKTKTLYFGKHTV